MQEKSRKAFDYVFSEKVSLFCLNIKDLRLLRIIVRGGRAGGPESILEKMLLKCLNVPIKKTYDPGGRNFVL